MPGSARESLVPILTGPLRAALAAIVACCLLGAVPATAAAPGIEVTPSNILIGPGQMATSLTVRNRTARAASFQVRAYGWQQDSNGDDMLSPTAEIVSSPPIATIAPGGSQVIRLVLRRAPAAREGTYRILLDQLPPPAESGVVHLLLRLSIPIFAQPEARIAPQLQWRVFTDGGEQWLAVTNSGNRHASLQQMTLSTADGRSLQLEMKSPPHVLAGATKRWRIVGGEPLSSKTLHLTGTADTGVIDERIAIDPAS